MSKETLRTKRRLTNLNSLYCRDLGEKLEQLKEKLSDDLSEKNSQFIEYEQGYVQEQGAGLVVCRFLAEGCQFSVPSIRGTLLYRS